MKRDTLFIEHILEAIRRVRVYTAGGEAEFLADPRTQDAVIRNLQILGEAAKRVSPDFVAAHPEVPWRSMAGLRDRVVHDYFGVSLTIVWDVVVNHLPPLESALQELLPGK